MHTFKKKVMLNFIGLIVMFVSVAQGAYWGLDPVKPRIHNYGNAYVAIAEGGNALFVNPAGNCNSIYNQIFLSGGKDYNLIYNGYVSSVFELNSKIKMGGGLFYRGINDIARTAYNSGSVQKIGTLDYKMITLFTSIGYKIQRRINTGINLKLYKENFTDTTSRFALSTDIGVQYMPLDVLQFGIVFENIINSGFLSNQLKYEVLPLNVRLGLALNLFSGRLQLLGDYEIHKTADYLNAMHLGFRFMVNDRLDANAGLSNSSVYAGFNFRIESVVLSYSFEYALNYLGVDHRIGVSWNFGRKYNLVRKGERYLSQGRLYDALRRFTAILAKNPNDRLATYYVKKIFMTYERNDSLRLSLYNYKAGKKYWADYWLNKAKFYDNILRSQ